MSEPKSRKRILKRALGGIVFCVGILLASSCGLQNNSQAPDNYWESHYYQAPAAHMRDQYYGWGQSWQNYYQYTPSIYYIPIYYLYFYPPWVFQPSQTTYYPSAPGWISSVTTFAQPPSSGSGTTTPTTPSTPSTPAEAYAGVSTVFFSAGEGSHTVGGVSCTAYGNFQSVGSVADCGSAYCYGNETPCKGFINEQVPTSDSSNVVVDFFVTAENSHIVGGPGCPAGYQMVASAADCKLGNCYGNQLFCELSVPASSLHAGSTYVRDVVFTQEGAHVVGSPGCPAGYTASGSVADCGGGTCYGNQLVCVEKAGL